MVGAWILTPRLILSAMTGDDVPRFHALVTRPRWRGFCSFSAPAGRLKRPGIFLADWAWSGGLCFRLPSEEAGQWRRWIGVSDDPEPEIFYRLTPEAAGRGLTPRGGGGIHDLPLRPLCRSRAAGGVFFDNPASVKLLPA